MMPPVLKPDAESAWRRKIRFDWFLLVFLYAVMMDRYTQNPFHETAGTASLILFGVHLWLNRAWCRGVVRQLAGQTAGRRRKSGAARAAMIMMNLLLGLLMTAAAVTGVMASQSLFAWATPDIWRMDLQYRTVHVALSVWAWLFAALHAGVHWKLFCPKLTASTLVRYSAAAAGFLFIAALPGAFERRELDLLLGFESAYIPVIPGEMPGTAALDFIIIFLGAAASAALSAAFFRRTAERLRAIRTAQA